jgi:hypothetical protein
MQWAFVDRRILEFVDDIVQAGEQSPLNVERTNARSEAQQA